MKPKKVLGRGLSALIAEADGAGKLGDKEVRLVPLGAIEFNPSQPRKSFNENSLKGLADSMSQVGVLQPILVRRLEGREGWSGSRSHAPPPGEPVYRVVAGERRVRAAKLAGITEVPSIICSYEETEALRVALLENIQREDLGPIEEATAFQNLLAAYGATQEELAAMLGKNRSSVANTLRLLSLETEIQDLLESGEISRGHAKALLGLQPGPARVRLAMLCRRRGLSVRECEERVQRATAGRRYRGQSRRRKRPEPPEIRALRERTERVLGSPVRIDRDPRTGKGTLTVRFFSDEDLERLLNVVGVATDL